MWVWTPWAATVLRSGVPEESWIKYNPGRQEAVSNARAYTPVPTKGQHRPHPAGLLAQPHQPVSPDSGWWPSLPLTRVPVQGEALSPDMSLSSLMTLLPEIRVMALDSKLDGCRALQRGLWSASRRATAAPWVVTGWVGLSLGKSLAFISSFPKVKVEFRYHKITCFKVALSTCTIL